MPPLLKVVLVGGPDVDARLELMRCLRGVFDVSALGSQPRLQGTFAAQGFDYRSYHLSRRVNPLADALTVIQLVGIIRRLKPHIIHTFDTKPGIWGCVAAHLAGVPVIVGTVTGLGSLYANDGLTIRFVRAIYQVLQKLACHVADVTMFQNQDDARQFITAGIVSAQKVLVMPGSGVATDVLAPDRVSAHDRAYLRAQLGIQPDEIVVTMISRVIRSKGVLEFMAAARHVHESYPQVRFLLIGSEDGESPDRLGAAELAQLKQVITWPGPRRDIPAVLAASDLFVLPSAYREGIPRVLLEAAAMGLSVVTTNSPGCNEVVKHGINGFLVPVRDSKALAKAIVCLIEQPRLRYHFGQVLRQHVVEHFDLSVIAAHTRRVYLQLLAHKAVLATKI